MTRLTLAAVASAATAAAEGEATAALDPPAMFVDLAQVAASAEVPRAVADVLASASRLG